jgi:hypothetical protein
VLDQSAVTLTAVRCPAWDIWNILDIWETCDTPSVTIHVRDKNGNAPLDGLVARLEPGLKFTGPGLRLMRQISVNLDGKEVRDFFTAPGSGERNVAAGGQASIKLAFEGFDPGEYIIPLRITAKNSGDDELQRLTVTLQVRNPAFVAVFVLVVAGLISFAATRLVTMLRQRAQRLIRVRALQTAWLANEPAILPVIWLRAALRQTRELSNKYWLAGQDELDNRLNGAAGMLSVLDGVRQARQQIEAIPSRKVRLRATWKLDKVVERIPAMPLTDTDVNRFKQDLATFDDWFSPDTTRLQNAFWNDLAAALRALYGEVQVPANPTSAVDLLMQHWLDEIHKPIEEAIAAPAALQNMEALQNTYERLAILWEARGHPAWAHDIEQLHPSKQSTECTIDRVYKVIDDGWWSELTRLGSDQLRIVSPTSTLEPIEAFQTIVFQVRIDADPALAESYLVRKKLKYQWTIEIYDENQAAARARPAMVLNVESTQPLIAQYSPTAGLVLASVRITYEGRQGPVVRMHDPIHVRASRDFQLLRIVATADVMAFLIALLASVLSGITLYALAPTFGSLKEYIALFTWAASFDQGKNFLQSLAAYNAGTSTPTTTATPAPTAAASTPTTTATPAPTAAASTPTTTATPAPTAAAPAPARPAPTPSPGGETPPHGGAPADGPAGHG